MMKIDSKTRQKIKKNMSAWLDDFGCPDSFKDGTSKHMMEDVVGIIERDIPEEKWKASNQ